MFLFIGVVMGLMVCGIRELNWCCFLYKLKTEYKFESGITLEDKTYISTHPVFFPERIREQGKYVIKNTTGYQICVAMPEDGFLFIEQGEYRIEGKPLVFFVVQPDTAKDIYFEGDLIVCKENTTKGISYFMKGNRNKISEIRCRRI